jgi:hypothetical protein
MSPSVQSAPHSPSSPSSFTSFLHPHNPSSSSQTQAPTSIPSTSSSPSSYPSVLTTFTYLVPLPLYEREKPFELLIDLPDSISSPDRRRTNIVFGPASQKQRVWSVRGRQAEFSLDVHGFAFRRHRTRFRGGEGWGCRDEVEKIYVKEMERWLGEEIGLGPGGRVVTYDWRVCAPLSLCGLARCGTGRISIEEVGLSFCLLIRGPTGPPTLCS